MTDGKQPSNDQLLMSVEDAAKLLGISRSLAYQLCERRELPTLRLGRRLVVPARVLMRMIEEAEIEWSEHRSRHMA
jgi:excisionase family DNA binding protein